MRRDFVAGFCCVRSRDKASAKIKEKFPELIQKIEIKGGWDPTGTQLALQGEENDLEPIFKFIQEELSIVLNSIGYTS